MTAAKPAQTETAETPAAEIDFTATNKWGVLLHVEGETKDERRKRLARETQKARRDADPEYAQSRRDASIKSHKKNRESDPEVQAKRLARLEKLAAELGYKIVALPAKKAAAAKKEPAA